MSTDKWLVFWLVVIGYLLGNFGIGYLLGNDNGNGGSIFAGIASFFIIYMLASLLIVEFKDAINCDARPQKERKKYGQNDYTQ